MENESMKSAPVKQEHKNITMDMTKGSPAGLLLRFAMPFFIGNLLQQFYNLADTSIAGHMLGDQALAEIGATAALYSLITNFAFGMNNGLALTVSRNFGAGNEKKMKQAVCWMTIVSIGTAFVLSGGFLLFQKTLLELLKIPQENMTGALAYLTVILRSAFQGMQHLLAPLFCSALELIGKVIFAVWLVPIWGYPAVCVCEPATWVVCCVFILVALYMFRGDFRDASDLEKA